MVQLEERYHAAVLAAITGCVAPFFTLLDTLSQWSAAQGVPPDLAARYVSAFFGAVCQEAAHLDAAGLSRIYRGSGQLYLVWEDRLTRSRRSWVRTIRARTARR